MAELSGNERFIAAGALEVTEVADGFVIYDEARDKIHYLNATAAVIYTLCDGTRSVSDIRAFLRDAYAIAEVPQLEDVFAEFEQLGLVLRAPAAD